MRLWVLFLGLWAALLPASPLLGPDVLNPGQFRVTQFITGLPAPAGMVFSTNGPSLLVNTSPFFSQGQLVRFVDANRDGIADGPGTVLYNSTSGPLTLLKDTGRFYVVDELGAQRFRMLAPGLTPDSPLTPVGDFQFSYPGPWDHASPGIAIRATPNSPGSIDIVFNVGSQFNDLPATARVTVSGWGLSPTELEADSLYLMTVDQTGPAPVVTAAPRRIVGGIRNVYGMGFEPVSGDLYFADNAIDLRTPPFEEPPQADELNRLTAAQIASGQTFDFGFPNCYIAYLTGTTVGSGCIQPIAAFQPRNGAQSEGPAEIAFAPSGFPAAYRNGVFIGFAGMGVAGVANTENPVVYFDFSNGQYIHFIPPALAQTGRPVSITAGPNSIWVADFFTGDVWEISSVPEPSTAAGVAAALLALWIRARYCQRDPR